MNKTEFYKTPIDSKTTKTEVVCPNDTNPMGLLKGGRLVEWMDMAAAVCAQIHADKICVTASVSHIDFMRSAKVGDIIFIYAIITRTFKTSMEIQVLADSKDVLQLEQKILGEGFFTFVALDEIGNATDVLAVKPTSADEIMQHENALHRRNKKAYLAINKH
ncbi:MAG: acyl-CoA thioesterase [Bacteroidetes bacterium]|nr:acyl-CoA thioesterase [Bacteroidota bacterium]